MRSIAAHIAIDNNNKEEVEKERTRAISHSLRDISMSTTCKLVAINAITLGRLLMTDRSSFTRDERQYLDKQIAYYQNEMSTQWNCYLLEKSLYEKTNVND